MRSHFVLQEIWIGLRRNLTMTMALIVVVAISLSLLGTGLLFVKQVNSTRTYWQGKVEISVYLCTANSVSNKHSVCPPTTSTPIDLFVPEPGPLEIVNGNMPATSAIVVIRIGRKRSRFARIIASNRSMPRARNWFV